MMRSGHGRRLALLVAVIGCISCGEVFSDYELEELVIAHPSVTPDIVWSGATVWLEVRVEIPGDSVSIHSHSIDGRHGVWLASDTLGIFPGSCPSGAAEAASVPIDVSGDQHERDTDGHWVFCTAIQVGPTQVERAVPLTIAFWDGVEVIKGRAWLTVYPADAAASSGEAL